MAATPRVLLDGLIFPEGPRWHDGALYFSDMHGRAVWQLSPEGKGNKVAEFPDEVSGLGWLPSGTMLVVSMSQRLLLRLTPRGQETAAGLSWFVGNSINGMVVDRLRRAYICGVWFYFFHD